MNNKEISAVIVAGGKGLRMGEQIPKQFLELDGKTIIERTVYSFLESGIFNKIVIVCNRDYLQKLDFILSGIITETEIEICEGGQTRQESVYNGLKCVQDSYYVMIHDAVRCLITPDMLRSLANELLENNACALGVRVKDTIKISDEKSFIASTPARDKLWQIQTPQCFKTSDILNYHILSNKNNLSFTDDCGLAERFGAKIKIVEGSDENIKVTTPFDMVLASEILKRRKSK